ncbi:MAG: hypothetical protein ACRDNG_10265 [Gaiellaceae bacterium]
MKAAARSVHKNHCLFGYGVSEMEMWGDLQRWNAGDARWYVLDNCHRGPVFGATELRCESYYECYHPNATRKYRAATSAYTVVKGTAYFVTDYSGTVTKVCT